MNSTSDPDDYRAVVEDSLEVYDVKEILEIHVSNPDNADAQKKQSVPFEQQR